MKCNRIWPSNRWPAAARRRPVQRRGVLVKGNCAGSGAARPKPQERLDAFLYRRLGGDAQRLHALHCCRDCRPPGVPACFGGTGAVDPARVSNGNTLFSSAKNGGRILSSRERERARPFQAAVRATKIPCDFRIEFRTATRSSAVTALARRRPTERWITRDLPTAAAGDSLAFAETPRFEAAS